jgi:hypothetical protein
MWRAPLLGALFQQNIEPIADRRFSLLPPDVDGYLNEFGWGASAVRNRRLLKRQLECGVDYTMPSANRRELRRHARNKCPMLARTDGSRASRPLNNLKYQLSIDRLEERCCPAGIQAYLNGSSLLIFGTDGNDVVNVQTLAGNQSILVVNGQPFNKASIDFIAFNGGKGNDRFVVDANIVIDALIYGGAGNDSLVGGGGADFINGGAGKDKINGGPGADLLFGGGADDLLVGAAGVDSVFGGAGDDRLFAVDVSISNQGQADLLVQGAYTFPPSFTSVFDTFRRTRGLGPVTLDQKLVDTAVDHASQLATRFSRDGYSVLESQPPLTAGFKNTVAVTIVVNRSVGDLSALAALVSNGVLRSRLESAVFTRIGVGVAYGPNDQVFLTVVFGQPQKGAPSSSEVAPVPGLSILPK